MKTTHLLALAVDMPAMTAAHLGTLWAAATPGCGLLPCPGDHSELLPAIYPAEALTIASAHLAGPDFSLGALNRELIASGLMKMQTIAPADASLYENCNSPADWQRHADS
jgi:molybdopterin-guanine dinucleotide biosynthesis protein A